MNAEALFLLHGFTGAPSSFDGLAPLASKLRLIAPPLVGHGRPSAAPGVDVFTAEVDRLLALAPARSLLVGYSLGARLALGLLLREPARFSGAVLIGANPGLRTEAERRARAARDAELGVALEARGLEAFVDQWEAEPLFASQSLLPREVRAAERARRLSHTAVGLARSLRATGLAGMPDYWGHLQNIDCPVELLTGALDERFAALATVMARELPRGRATVVPEAGHNLLLERPGSVVEAIARGLLS